MTAFAQHCKDSKPIAHSSAVTGLMKVEMPEEVISELWSPEVLKGELKDEEFEANEFEVDSDQLFWLEAAKKAYLPCKAVKLFRFYGELFDEVFNPQYDAEWEKFQWEAAFKIEKQRSEDDERSERGTDVFPS